MVQVNFFLSPGSAAAAALLEHSLQHPQHQQIGVAGKRRSAARVTLRQRQTEVRLGSCAVNRGLHGVFEEIGENSFGLQAGKLLGKSLKVKGQNFFFAFEIQFASEVVREFDELLNVCRVWHRLDAVDCWDSQGLQVSADSLVGEYNQLGDSRLGGGSDCKSSSFAFVVEVRVSVGQI